MHQQIEHPTRRHPFTGEPLVALGVTKRGDVIWPQMGGDDTVPPATPPQQTPPAGPAVPPPAQLQTPPWERAGQPFDADRAWKRIQAQAADNAKLTAENAALRSLHTSQQASGTATQQQTQGQQGQTGQQQQTPAGPGDSNADYVAELEAELFTRDVKDIARGLGADVDALFGGKTAGSKGFIAALDQLDGFEAGDAEGAKKAITAFITEFITDNPRYKAGAGQQRRGADVNGGTPAKQRPASLGDAIANRLQGR